jgi:hypothetical protein
MKPLSDFTDNDETAYEVPIGRIFWKFRPGDVTAPLTQMERVTKGRVRQMFMTFIQDTPTLQGQPRDEQIRQFNLHRRELKQEPKIPAELLVDVLV